MRITCVDLSERTRHSVATVDGLVPSGERMAVELALDGMLLAMSPDHAARMVEAARAHEFANAATAERA